MSACEKCWTQASFEAAARGGFTVDHYKRLLIENEGRHVTEGAPTDDH